MDRPEKLGVYEILSPLGAGGMGEVYRARDPRLKRDVAVKILSAKMVFDSEHRKRFEYEAQAASALNHPNILVIHDIGFENDVHYLVSELIEGESLRKLLQQGAVSIKKLLEIAVQIADGLAAAHQAGIVHRDLKPENIMITPEDRVKILDFGLAKLSQRTIEEEETVSHALSRSGMIRGTVPYMSPEQASGKTVDFRSDQFSFGLILYEMATGQRAFQQETPVQLLSAIIAQEPAAISTLNPRTPGPLRWIIERCITKEPRQRYDSTVDLYRELRSLRDHLSETSTSVEEAVRIPSKRFGWRHFAALLILMIAGLAVITVAVLTKQQPRDFSKYKVSCLASKSGITIGAAWSPDGNMIAYSTNTGQTRQIFTKDLRSLVSTRISDPKQECRTPVWSIDGSRLYYVSGNDLWMISAAGGSAQKIFENVSRPSISIKANALIFSRREGEKSLPWISSPPGAEPRKFLLPANIIDLGGSNVAFSPDGSKIALWGRTEQGISFFILPYPSGTARTIRMPKEIMDDSAFSWMQDGKHIVFGSASPYQGKNQLRILDTDDGTADLLLAGYGAPATAPVVSPDGSRIIFSTLDLKGDLVEIPLDGSGSKDLPMESSDQISPAWSPTGTQYAFAGENSGLYGIWLGSVMDSWTRPIVTAKELKAETFDSPSFSPDGQRIAYQIDSREIWISPVSGGQPVRLVPEKYVADFPSWSPDGNWISFYSAQILPGTYGALMKISTTGNAKPVVVKEGMEYYSPRWSPDGNWITCITEQGLSVVSPDGKKVRFLSSGKWGSHDWSHDSSTIYGFKFDGRHRWLCSVELKNGIEKKLNGLSETTVEDYLGLSLSRDELSVISSKVRYFGNIWLMENFAQPSGFLARLRQKF